MVSGLFFPWRNTFKRLELEHRWWHRLALVLFFATLTVLLFATWFLTMNGTEPTNAVLQNTRYWYVDAAGSRVDLHEPPQEATGLAPEAQDTSNTTVTEWDASGKPIYSFAHQNPGAQGPWLKYQQQDLPARPAATGNANVKLDLSKALAIHAAVDMPSGETREFVGKSPKEIKTEWDRALRKARLHQVLMSLGVALVVTLVFSYLLQSFYRALLYVIYGSPKREA